MFLDVASGGGMFHFRWQGKHGDRHSQDLRPFRFSQILLDLVFCPYHALRLEMKLSDKASFIWGDLPAVECDLIANLRVHFISISFVQFYSFPCFILLSSKCWRDDFCMPLFDFLQRNEVSYIFAVEARYPHIGMRVWIHRNGDVTVRRSFNCLMAATLFFLVPRNSLVAWQVTPSPFTRPTSLCPLRPQRVGKWKMWKLWNRKHQETCVRGSFGILFLQRKETFTPHGFQSHYSRPRLHRFWRWIRRLWKFLEDLRCKRCRVEVASRNKCIDEYNSFRCFHILRFYLSHFFSNPQHTYFTIYIHLPIFLYLKISFILIYLLIIHDVLHEYMLHLHLYY